MNLAYAVLYCLAGETATRDNKTIDNSDFLRYCLSPGEYFQIL